MDRAPRRHAQWRCSLPPTLSLTTGWPSASRRRHSPRRWACPTDLRRRHEIPHHISSGPLSRECAAICVQLRYMYSGEDCRKGPEGSHIECGFSCLHCRVQHSILLCFAKYIVVPLKKSCSRFPNKGQPPTPLWIANLKIRHKNPHHVWLPCGSFPQPPRENRSCPQIPTIAFTYPQKPSGSHNRAPTKTTTPLQNVSQHVCPPGKGNNFLASMLGPHAHLKWGRTGLWGLCKKNVNCS